MKKTYNTPKTLVVKVEEDETILAGSPTGGFSTEPEQKEYSKHSTLDWDE